MPYPFPVQRYREFKNWIPESDADGIDSKEQFIADSENIDFENGFISNARQPSEVTVPVLIQLALDTGYEILSSKFFTHSIRGNIEFYVLYRYHNDEHLLKFFVSDNVGTTQLFIDVNQTNVTFESKPTLITYALMQNQLKVNLNIIGNYFELNKRVYLNLTLGYIDGRYGYGTGGGDIGWNLFPRWLGWSYNDDILQHGALADVILDMEGSLDSGKVTETITTKNCVVDSGQSISGSGSDSCKMTATWSATTGDDVAYYDIAITEKLNKIKFYYNTWAESTYGGDRQDILKLILIDSDDNIFYKVPMSLSYGLSTYFIEDNSLLSKTAKIRILLNSSKTNIDGYQTIVNIDDIKLSYRGYPYVIIARYYDNQRAMLNIGDEGLFYDGGTTFKINKNAIDKRVVAYEVYYLSSKKGFYYKWLDFSTTDSGWSDNGTYYEFDAPSSLWIKNSSETLNSNYGLGKSIKVYPFELSPSNVYGSPIYREALYKGRNYYVRYDENLYYSHLSGSGLPQPDSFPTFENGKPVNYILISNQDKCIGVAISSLNELVVQTNKKTFLYLMQFNGATFYRKRRVINGSFGLGAVNSLVTDLNGTPRDEVLFWVNKWGMFIYGGGVQAPKNITYVTHKNYWKDLDDATKAQILSFYNPQRREFWSVLGNIIIIYEIPTHTFRKYRLPFKIREFVGIKDKIAYVLGNDNKIYKLDPKHNRYLDGYIETHYSTNTLIFGQYPISSWEFQHKIMQDIFVAFKESVTGVVKYTIIADGNIIEPNNIIFDSSKTIETLPSPLLVRYGKVKLRITIPSSSVKVKEFGYSFNVPSHGFGHRGANINSVSGLGQSSGLSVGEHL